MQISSDDAKLFLNVHVANWLECRKGVLRNTRKFDVRKLPELVHRNEERYRLVPWNNPPPLTFKLAICVLFDCYTGLREPQCTMHRDTDSFAALQGSKYAKAVCKIMWSVKFIICAPEYITNGTRPAYAWRKGDQQALSKLCESVLSNMQP